MAFTGNYTCNTFLTGLPSGTFNLNTGTSNVFKIALYTNSAALTDITPGYTSVGETSGGNYVAGGQILVVSQIPVVTNNAQPAFFSFTNAAWTGSITARGALIYKYDGITNPAMVVLDFGSDKTSAATFTVQFPTANNSSAIIRIGY
jgi:hypothetical protein